MIDNNIVNITKLFLAWQDQEEEAWLREMSKSGLHLVKAAFAYYTFTRGEPREHIYRLDFRNEMRSDLKAYYQLFEEAGWEHVTYMGGWQYWRKPYLPNQAGEIYSDPDSKIEKYKRLLLYLIGPMILLVASSLNLMNINSTSARVIFIPIFAAVFVLSAVCLVMVYRRIQQLKRL